MDRELSDSFRRRRLTRRVGWTAACIALVTGAVVFGAAKLRPSVEWRQIRVGRVPESVPDPGEGKEPAETVDPGPGGADQHVVEDVYLLVANVEDAVDGHRSFHGKGWKARRHVAGGPGRRWGYLVQVPSQV